MILVLETKPHLLTIDYTETKHITKGKETNEKQTDALLSYLLHLLIAKSHSKCLKNGFVFVSTEAHCPLTGRVT